MIAAIRSRSRIVLFTFSASLPHGESRQHLSIAGGIEAESGGWSGAGQGAATRQSYAWSLFRYINRLSCAVGGIPSIGTEKYCGRSALPVVLSFRLHLDEDCGDDIVMMGVCARA